MMNSQSFTIGPILSRTSVPTFDAVGIATRRLPMVRRSLRRGVWRVVATWLTAIAFSASDSVVASVLAQDPQVTRPAPFEIQVLDAQTGRGIPLVILETVNQVTYVTDNFGRIAYEEPQHLGRTIWFRVKAHGYEVPVDGLGIPGTRFEIKAGGRAELKLKRINVAERLYRITGEDRYRDSLLLGHPSPLRDPLQSGFVAGQDSVQGVVFDEQVHWFWGDTNRLSYVLGLFRTAGATTQLPGIAGLDPIDGLDFDYRVGEDGFVRAMVEVEVKEGVVWLDGVAVLVDELDEELMVGHFSRRMSLADEVEHGIVVWSRDDQLFRVAARRELDDTWRFPHSHPESVEEAGVRYLQFGQPFLTCRVPADLDAVMDVTRYESWSCVAADRAGQNSLPSRRPDGALDWQWRKGSPVSPSDERRWLEAGLIEADEALFLPEDFEQPGKHVVMHSGTVRWNPYRGRWILIAMEIASDPKSPSLLGEVWYSESTSPQGPFARAVRILSHDKQSFYNPCHHPFFDRDGGRSILFEGTYTNTFTNAPPTPRYDYNQIMYRLDLDDPRLRAAFGDDRD